MLLLLQTALVYVAYISVCFVGGFALLPSTTIHALEWFPTSRAYYMHDVYAPVPKTKLPCH